jgi:hypothetical protein
MNWKVFNAVWTLKRLKRINKSINRLKELKKKDNKMLTKQILAMNETELLLYGQKIGEL